MFEEDKIHQPALPVNIDRGFVPEVCTFGKSMYFSILTILSSLTAIIAKSELLMALMSVV